tara:strand:- start:766 stop:900 length:135 start_codon:yes stop_codon:yes gene_type:complete
MSKKSRAKSKVRNNQAFSPEVLAALQKQFNSLGKIALLFLIHVA